MQKWKKKLRAIKEAQELKLYGLRLVKIAEWKERRARKALEQWAIHIVIDAEESPVGAGRFDCFVLLFLLGVYIIVLGNQHQK